MKQMSSADFRKSYASESEPVEVTSYGKSLGVWTPAAAPGAPDALAPVADHPHRMTIRPVKASLRPPLVGVERRVYDTTELRREERARWDAATARPAGRVIKSDRV